VAAEGGGGGHLIAIERVSENSMPSNDPTAFLRFDEWRTFFAANQSGQAWQTVYQQIKGPNEDGLLYSALIPDGKLAKALESHSWDLRVGDGSPGISGSGHDKEAKSTYDRLGFLGGFEPLVICRSFHSGSSGFREISEEFRLFHNLYQGKKRDEYIKDDDAGNPELVARLLPDKVEIRTKEIRQFLAIKEMHLSIQIDVSRYTETPVKDFPSECHSETIREKDASYDWGIRSLVIREPYKTHAFISGKKLVTPVPKSESGMWPYRDRASEKYPAFIIGRDEEGKEIEFTCDDSKLSNNFGANPGAPHFLTPIHFRSEVLSKYYSQSDRYSVEDGYLRAGSLWGLKMDNDHGDRIIVFLGDLACDLPEAERDYWRSFNIPPEGPELSKTAYTRSIRGWFAEPARPDLVFKNLFPHFSKSWMAKFSWELFLPLSKDDRHHFTALRIPVHNDQAEFDSQVQSLTKLIVDSLNEAMLAKDLSLPPETKGISKFESFLNAKKAKETPVTVKFLRDLQTLRSTGVAHRKGRNYENIAKIFDLEAKELKEVAAGLFADATRMLRSLGAEFLPEQDWDSEQN
jgi:hypothetical protein